MTNMQDGLPVGSADDDGPDLSKATLFADSARGVYIPQCFATDVRRELVTGVSDEDYKVLEAGPDHEHYWEAWQDVLDNATIQDPKLGECYLHHDMDLWIVPVEKEPPPLTKTVLGYTFKTMTRMDWDSFAGAEEGSLICHDCKDATLILHPDGTISAIGEDTQTDWVPSTVL
jgi:hypothetical protein